MSEVWIEGRVPAHDHGNITPEGAIGTVANKAVYTGVNGVLQAGTLPVSAGGTGRNTLTAGAFLRGAGTGAVTLTPAADVAGLIGAAAPLAVNTGWKLQFSRTTAGSFTWTAPDLFGGKVYKIGVLVIGGGGSGAASSYFISSGNGGYASGGASGYAISFEMQVTPGTAYSGVVGSGGGSVTASSASGTAGNAGGTSSFAGKTAYGGQGGPLSQNYSSNGAVGGQCSFYAGAASSETSKAYGGRNVRTSSSGGVGEGMPGCCFNPFENKQILGAGASISGGNANRTVSGGKDPVNPSYGGGNAVVTTGSATGGSGNQPGCGGGGAISLNGSTSRSGNGAAGAVYIYVQGVT